MKTLKNHKLLIDNECPMCRMYSGAFEKLNYLENGSCIAYQKADYLLDSKVDAKRARNEIALFDNLTGETTYGIDALTKILANRFWIIGYMMQLKPIRTFMYYLYKFISQNRKVIAPSDNLQSTCVPDVDLKYRFTYVFFVAIFSSVVINNYSVDINILMGWKSSFVRELMVCFGQIAWQLIFFGSILKNNKWEYIGNLSTVSLIGTILLLPGLFLTVHFKIVWFVLVVGIMTLEHLRRCKLLQIGLWPTVSWIMYRLVVLAVISFLI